MVTNIYIFTTGSDLSAEDVYMGDGYSPVLTCQRMFTSVVV